MCGNVCLGLYKAHAHCDCCKARHVYQSVRVCVPHEVVCQVCALSLLLLKHNDTSFDQPVLTSLIFLCSSASHRTNVW
jgi:hypothetical protein